MSLSGGWVVTEKLHGVSGGSWLRESKGNRD